jgi:hypothetical protein
MVRWTFVRCGVDDEKTTKRQRQVQKGSIGQKLALVESGLEKLSGGQIRHELGLKSAADWRLRKQETQDQLRLHKSSKMDMTRKRARYGKFHDLELKLLEWIDKALSLMKQTKVGVSMSMILQKANQLGSQLGKTDFKANKGWFHRFTKRHCLKRVKMHGEALDVDVASFEEDLVRLKTILSNFEPNHIFNMDETGLFYRYNSLLLFTLS